MIRFPRILLPLVVLACSPPASAQDARTVIDAAIQAMGMNSLQAITYSGTAAYGNFGQSRTLSFRLASTTIRDYSRTIDFVRGISHAVGDALPPGAPNGVPPGPFEDLITPASPGVKQLEIWTTPWGFLLGASKYPSTVKTTKLTPPGADRRRGDVSRRQLGPTVHVVLRRALPDHRLHRSRQPGRQGRDVDRPSDHG